MRVFIFVVPLLVLCYTGVFAQILIPNYTPVTQNFNGIGNSATASLPANWKMSGPGLGATANWSDAANVTQTTQAANSGTPTAGGRYNWGTSLGTDRAIGFMTDANYQSPNAIMAYYRNTTGSTVSTWTITFSIERYRTNTNTFSLQFFASVDGITWQSFPAGDIASNVFATGSSSYSFANPATQTRTVVINYAIPNNGDGYLKWVFINTNSTDAQGLGLDNVSIAAEPEPLPNPDLDPSCPYNIILVLDETGSVVGEGGGGAGIISPAIRAGATDIVDALVGTNSRLAVVEFGAGNTAATTARRAVIGGTTAYQTVDATYRANFITYITNDANNTNDATSYDPEDGNGSTNFDAMFVTIQTVNATQLADLVIIIADPRTTEPNAYTDDNTGNVVTGASVAVALPEAIVSANGVKAQGSHIFFVGVANPVAGVASIEKLSGPDRLPDIEPDFSKADYTLSSADSLQNILAAIASLVCTVDLQISKSSSPSACAGSNITFTLIASNNGDNGDSNIVVIDTIPSGFTYVSSDGGNNDTVIGNILTWNVGTLAGNGGADTLLVFVKVNASGNYTNRAYITGSGTQPDTDSTNNQDLFTVSITASCDDGIACTRDSCGTGGTCINTPYSVTASISPATATICAGSSSTLTASGSGGVGNYTFSWSTGATTAAITVSPSSTTSYTVTVTDANRCSAAASQTVTVSQAPDASISPQNAGICNGQSITLTASGGTTYSWSTGETTASITVSPTSTTQYSVTVSIGTCTASASRNVSVNQSPNVTITPSSATICPGNSVTLTATGAGGGGSYSWSTGATTASITVSPLVTTSYIVTVTNAQRCSISDTVTVTVNPSLTATISPDNVAICAGASATLTASGGTSFSWSTGATTASITVSPNSTTTYSVTVTDNSGCSGTASRIVTVNPLPNPAISPQSAAICPGGSITLTASGGTAYSWNTGASSASITVSPPSTTSFSVTVTDANGCTNSTSRTVTVNPPPTPTISPQTVAICPGGSATLTASGGISFSWNTGATTSSIIVSPVSTSTFSVTVTDANGCTAAASRQVTVNTPPTASVSPSDVSICAGASATLTASGGTSYSWNTGATTAVITVSPSSTTTYSVTVTDANGCTASASRTVTVNQLPAAAISPATAAICIGNSVTLTASGGISFSWNTGATTASITVSPASSTTYSVTVTGTAGGCTATASRTVTVNPLPSASISPSAVAICPGASAILTASGGTSFSWSTGAATASITVSPSITTTYSVTVTDANGCTAAASRQVTVNTPPTASVSPSDVSICAGASATLTASGGTSYSWNTGATTAVITVSPSSTTTYSVTVTDANGCTASASRTVTVNQLPAAAISPATAAICIGNSVTLTASGGISFSWNTGATTASITVSPASSTTYSVTVTGTAGGCTATASRTVTVNPLPPATISPATVAICQGASATLTANGGTSYSWNTGATTPAITVAPSGTSAYSVTVTDASGCSATASRTVTVNPLPAASITASANEVCSGEGVFLTASGGVSYSWNIGAAVPDITVTVTFPYVYIVTVTDASGCSDTASVFLGLMNCDDGNICTDDLCVNSQCTHSPIPGCCLDVQDCTEGDACTDEACIGNRCYYSDVCCDDDNGCTWDYCDNGGCIYVPKFCEDSNPCTDNVCVGSQCIFPPTSCNDNDPCTNDACQNGNCLHIPITCNDGNPCTADFCNNGCRFVQIPCSDGNSCTRDTCIQGTCISFNLNCSDNNACTNDACVNGICIYSPVQIDVMIAKTDVSCGNTGSGTPLVLDFAGLPHGTILNEQYASYGIHISGDASNSNSLDKLIVFNSFVTGSPDPDLQVDVGNLAVIPANLTDQNNDGLVDAPNDYAGGGKQIYLFDTPREVLSFKFIDKEGSPGSATAYDAQGNIIKTVTIPPMGDGSVQTIVMNAQGVSRLEIVYNESGGVTDIRLGCGQECCDGFAFAFASGGTAPYFYQWNSGQTTDSIGRLCEGRYCVTVSDVNGCSAEHCVGIDVESVNCDDGDPCTIDACQGSCIHTPIPGCGPPPCFAVTGYTLVYESTFGVIGPLTNGMVISRDTLCRFNIRADFCGNAKSIKFVLNGNTFRIENFVPFALAGDNPPYDYHVWQPAPGNYTLTATPYTQLNATGNAGTPMTITFTVVGPAANTSVVCSQPPYFDCHGDAYGSAFIDGCGVCAGGNTGIIPNTSCGGCVSQVNIVPEIPPAFCQSEQVTLQAIGPSRSAYQWSTGATSMNILATPGISYSVTLTDAYGCSASDSYTVQELSNLLSAYVLIAETEVLLQKSTVFSGGAGVTNASGLINMQNGAMITAPGTFAKAASISVTGGSMAAVQILSPAGVSLPPFEYNLSAGGSDVNVSPGSSVTLTNSVYGNIFAGSNATLTLTQPVIDIQSLATQDNVTVLFSSPCVKLRIAGGMDLQADNIFNPDFREVIIYAGGNVKVWDRSRVVADIYTLQELEVEEGTPQMPTVMRGLYIAHNIIGEEYSQFHINPACNCRGQAAAKVSQLEEEKLMTPSVLENPHISLKAYPNPFSEKLNIEIISKENSSVKLDIFNVSGQRVITLFEDEMQASESLTIAYKPRSMTGGMVIYRLKSDGGTWYGKAVMVR